MAKKSTEKQDPPLFGAEPGQQVAVITDVGAARIELSNVVQGGVKHLRDTYMGVTINGPDDKDGAEKVKEGWQTIRNTRIAVNKRREELIAPALEFQRGVNGAAQSIMDELATMEADRKRLLDAHEEAKRQAKLEKQRQEEAKFIKRTTELFNIGATFNGSFYQLETAVTTPSEIKEADDATFSKLLEKFQTEATRKAEADRLKAEAEEKQRLEAERLKAEAEAKERKAQEEAAELLKKLQAAQLTARAAQLKEIGFVAYFEGEKKAGLWVEGYDATRISANQMRTWDDETWEEHFRFCVDYCVDLKAEAERKAEEQRAAAEVKAAPEPEPQPQPEQVHVPVHTTTTATPTPEATMTEATTPTKVVGKAVALIDRISAAFEAAKSKSEFRQFLTDLRKEYGGDQ